MIGQTIANYKIISLLGAGGMGTVYLAEHVKLGRQVAIKSLHAQFVNSEEIRARFIHEAKVMGQLQHPNIVTLYDYVETETGLFLIIELVDGKPIDDYIEQVSGPIEERKAIEMMHEILDGFQYAHEKGLVHRDIKPSNLVVAAKNKVKILDFGIAKLVGDTSSKMTKTGTQIGTVYYMSPEQVKGDELDHRSDIYALGVTFFQMLTGNSPYKGMTKEFEVFMKIVNEDLPDPRTIYPGVSAHMCAIITKATARDVNERFQSCDEFAAALKDESIIALNDKQIDSSSEVFSANLKEQKDLTAESTLSAKDESNKSSEKEVSNLKSTKVPNNTNNDITASKRKNNKNKLFGLISGMVLMVAVLLYFLFPSSANQDQKLKTKLVTTVIPRSQDEKTAFNTLTLIRQRIIVKKRESFAKLAKKYSSEPNGIGYKVIYIIKGQLPIEFDEMADKLDKFEVSPIFEFTNDNGLGEKKYAIMKLISKNNDGCYKMQFIRMDIGLEIGQRHRGGIIFYLDNSGKHGKVCSEKALGKFRRDPAMKVCQNLRLNGFNDWHLPSLVELGQLYTQRSAIGGFGNAAYWSSHDDGNGNHWYFSFLYGNASNTQRTDYSLSPLFVRAIRSF